MVAPPSPAELREILKRTTGTQTDDTGKVLPDDGGKLVHEMQHLLRQVLIAPPIEDYVVRMVHATQPNLNNGNGAASPVQQYLRFGSSPRGAQAVILGAKGNALADGRIHVSYEDVARVIYPALRHRIILNFQAEAENVNTDQILAEVVKQIPRA
jgi:MoxR-like ATPase